MMYLAYGLLAVLVVLFSIKLSQYVDALDKKTNLSGAFIGGVMLAAVTSLPELFTSLTAVLALDQPQLVQGDVLGSNVFNLCIIAVVILIATNGYRKSQVSRSHKQTLFYGLVMYALVFLAIIKPITLDLGILNVNLMTILILIVYAINVRSMKGDDSADNDEPCDLDLTVLQITVRFLLFSVALVLVSILLTQVTNIIAKDLNMGATVAGAIFLGVATSLPELSASISLMRLGNFNASFGNVVGSNLFNFIIFCFADIIYTKGSIYLNDGQVMNLIGFGALSSVIALGFLYGKKHTWLLRVLSILILGCYVFSIACSM